MHARSRRLCQTLVSSTCSRGNRREPTSFRRLENTFANKLPSIGNLIRTLNSSNISYRVTGTEALYRNEMALIMKYKELLEAQKDPNVLIIDVREPSEINETGALPGSIHIPMADVSNELENLSEEEFQEKYSKPKPTKNTKIVFSCRSGRRSATVQEKMQSLGYTQTYNYEGGWLEWEEKGKGKKEKTK